jgi:hypothetical protein
MARITVYSPVNTVNGRLQSRQEEGDPAVGAEQDGAATARPDGGVEPTAPASRRTAERQRATPVRLA